MESCIKNVQFGLKVNLNQVWKLVMVSISLHICDMYWQGKDTTYADKST